MTNELYIFGSSTNAQAALAVCRKHGIIIAGFLDDFSNEPEVAGIPILRPEAAPRDKWVIVASPTHCHEIMLRLKDMGFAVINLSQFYSSLGLEPDWFGDVSIHRPEYEWLRSELGDQKSLDVLDGVIRFRETLDTKHTVAICTNIALQWFDPDFFVPGTHVFVDGGAYDGDSCEAFIKACPEYEAAYLFEPSSILAEKARTRFKDCSDVIVCQSGLHGMRGSAFLENAGTPSGRLGSNGEHVVFDRLDAMTIATPTFIKLDVEGVELDALQGARRIITESKPFIACAVYHTPGHIWQVPRLLRSMRPDYKFFLRHYTQFYHETVLYAV